MTTKLPTADEMLAQADAELSVAYKALGDAADWLRSDWTPVGSPLTKRQADRRTADAEGHRRRQGRDQRGPLVVLDSPSPSEEQQ
jgi:hypothetical protein